MREDTPRHPKGPHGKRTEGLDFDRHGEETETLVRQAVQVRQVLDDGDVVAQQDGVHRAASVRGVVDVERVDADEGGAGVAEQEGGAFGQKRMVLEVGGRSPMLRPAGVHQHRLARHVTAPERRLAHGLPPADLHPNDDSVESGYRRKRQLRQVFPLGIAVKRRVDVGARVGDHLDLADGEFGAWRVVRP